MDNKIKLLVEFINLKKKQLEDEKPYNKLFDNVSLFDTIYETNCFICKLLGIDESIEWAIDDLIIDGECWFAKENGEEFVVKTPEEFAAAVYEE